MVEIRALQTQRALLTLEPYEISLEQISATLPARRGGPAQNEHDQVLTFFGARHAGILHPTQMGFQHICQTWRYRANIRLLVTV